MVYPIRQVYTQSIFKFNIKVDTIINNEGVLILQSDPQGFQPL